MFIFFNLLLTLLNLYFETANLTVALLFKIVVRMDVRRIFSREAMMDFPEVTNKIFPGEAKSGKISFFFLETRKTTFLC